MVSAILNELSASSLLPLLLILLTVGVYLLSSHVQRRCKDAPWLHPIVISVFVVGGILQWLQIDYETYFEANQIIHFLLGPATVALAVPLYYQLRLLQKIWFPVIFSLCCGSLTAMIAGVLLAQWLGADMELLLALAPKSVTAPVALGISQQLGGVDALTITLVVLTGITGLIIGPILFRWLDIDDDIVKGVAIGVVSHGMGVAYSYQQGKKMGVYAGLAMVLAAIFISMIIPLLSFYLLVPTNDFAGIFL
jgi:predicted murein hydrolase (TIGR00659 family)